jgi:NTE family protein
MSKPIRVALSGSGTRLSAHVGALQAISDAGFTPEQIAATSGGSIVGAIYSAGMSLSDLKDLAFTVDFSKVISWSPLSALAGAFCSGANALDFLRANCAGKRFSDLAIDFKAVASNLIDEKEFLFSAGTTPLTEVALAARASSSIPFVYETVPVPGGLLVDGGCADNLPADYLTVDAIPRVAIYLVSEDAVLSPGRHSIFTLAGRVIDLMLASNEDTHVRAYKEGGATVVSVPTGYANSLDRHMPLEIRQRLYADGYAATAAALAKMTVPA